jgi:hypothetical protein
MILFYFYVGSTKVWTQGLVFGRLGKSSTTWSRPLSLFFFIFQMRFLVFAWVQSQIVIPLSIPPIYPIGVHHHILFIYGEAVVLKVLPGLTSKHNPPDLCLPALWFFIKVFFREWVFHWKNKTKSLIDELNWAQSWDRFTFYDFGCNTIRST